MARIAPQINYEDESIDERLSTAVHLPIPREAFKEAQPVFFGGSQAEQCLELMLHLCQFSEKILWLCGAEGVGKTTVKQEFLEKTQNSFKLCSLIAESDWDVSVLMRRIAQGFGLPWESARGTEAFSTNTNINMTSSTTLSATPWVLVIDDVHHLSLPVLNALLQLSKQGLSVEQQLHLVLVGNNTFERSIQHSTLKPFVNGRLQIIELEPLTPTETAKYLKFRLSTIGIKNIPFEIRDVQNIFVRSKGIPRLINQLARNKLMDKQESQGEEEVGAKKSKFDIKAKLKSIPLIFWLIGSGILFVVLLIILLISLLASGNNTPATLTPSAAAEAAGKITDAAKKPEANTLDATKAALTNDASKTVNNASITGGPVTGVANSNGTAGTNPSAPNAELNKNNKDKVVVEKKPAAAVKIIPLDSPPGADPGVLLPGPLNKPGLAPTPVEPVKELDKSAANSVNTRADAPLSSNAPSASHTAVTTVLLPLPPKSNAEVKPTETPTVLNPTVSIETKPELHTPVALSETTPLESPKAEQAKAVITENSIKTSTSTITSPTIPTMVIDNKTKESTSVVTQPVLAPEKKISTNFSPAEQYLLGLPNKNYTIQIMASHEEAKIKEVIKAAQLGNKAHYYKTTFQGKPWYVLTVGNYTNRVAAQNAIDTLPLFQTEPWVRKLSEVQQQIRTRKNSK